MTETKLLPAGTVTILCAGDAAPAVFATPEEALAALAGGPAAIHTGEVLVRDDGTPAGPGGSGKTRLAAQVAATDEWPGGVWWVELDAVTGHAEVAELVAATLGVPVEPHVGAARSVATELRDRRVLLCLDNCEQVLD